MIRVETIQRAPRPEGAELVFANRSYRGLFLAGLLMGTLGLWACFYAGPLPAALPLLVAFGLTILGLLRRRQAQSPQNWILMQTPAGIYLNLRSYRNAQAAPDSHQCLFIPREAIAALNKTREKCSFPKRRGHRESFCNYLDLHLKDPAPACVRQAIVAERCWRPAQGHKHHEYPVRLLAPQTLRLLWDWIRPGEDHAVKLLGEAYPIAPEAFSSRPHWEQMNSEQRLAFIHDLWEAGKLSEALRLTQIHFSWTQGQAQQYLAEKEAVLAGSKTG